MKTVSYGYGTVHVLFLKILFCKGPFLVFDLQSLKRILLFGVLFSGLSIMASAALAADLDELVGEALDNNPDLAAMKARWEQSSYKAPQVGSLKDPVLSFAFSNYPSDDFSSDTTPMTGNELKLAQAFPFPGKLENRAALAREQAKWFEAAYYDSHYQVARKVKDAWYRLYFNQMAVGVVERNMTLIDDIIRLTEVRYETGSGLQQDVLKAQVNKSNLIEQLISLQQQKAVIEAELNRLLNRPAGTFEATVDLELPRTEVGLDEFQQAGVEKRPLNAAYQALIKRYRYQKKLAELDDYPDVTLWGSWRFRDDNLPDEGTDFVSAGISFNLPVYREKRRAATAEANAAMRMAEQQSAAFRSSVAESIQKAYARMQETFQQSELYSKGIIPQTIQSFQSALGAYQVGKVAFVSLLDALMATFKAEMDYYRVSSEYLRTLAWLEAESTLPLTGLPVVIDKDDHAGYKREP
jgi:outer membrane protein TolC